jgi:hypothetical protein
MRTKRFLIGLLAAAALAGCASRPKNEPITQFDPKSGYRPYLQIPKRQNNDPHTLFILAFSGATGRIHARPLAAAGTSRSSFSLRRHDHGVEPTATPPAAENVDVQRPPGTPRQPAAGRTDFTR